MTIEAIDFSRRQPAQPRLSTPYVPGGRGERHWKPEEDAILREHYPRVGAQGCAEKLPGRTLSAIYGRKDALGTKAGGRRPRRRHAHDPALDARIREAWPRLAGRGDLQRFADEIGVERWVISRRAVALGLTKAHRVKEPNWTSAEDEILTRTPVYDLAKAAKALRAHGFERTPTAIAVRLKRKGLSLRRRDVLSACAAAEMLGVDSKWITVRCIDGRIEAERRHTKRLVQQGGDTWAITPAALRRYVIGNLQEIDIRKVEKFAFVEMLVSAADGATQARTFDPASGERECA